MIFKFRWNEQTNKNQSNDQFYSDLKIFLRFITFNYSRNLFSLYFLSFLKTIFIDFFFIELYSLFLLFIWNEFIEYYFMNELFWSRSYILHIFLWSQLSMFSTHSARFIGFDRFIFVAHIFQLLFFFGMFLCKLGYFLCT